MLSYVVRQSGTIGFCHKVVWKTCNRNRCADMRVMPGRAQDIVWHLVSLMEGLRARPLLVALPVRLGKHTTCGAGRSLAGQGNGQRGQAGRAGVGK